MAPNVDVRILLELIALAIEDRDLALEVREFVMAVNSYSGLRYPQLREFL